MEVELEESLGQKPFAPVFALGAPLPHLFVPHKDGEPRHRIKRPPF